MYLKLFLSISMLLVDYCVSDQESLARYEVEGAAKGYLPDCPGSTKPVVITKESLKKLYMAVQGPESIINANVTLYNFYQMKQLANRPDIDFSKKTFLYVSGYLDNTQLPVSRTMGKMYKNMGYNVILMDYAKFTESEFPVTVRAVRALGPYIAKMLVKLTRYGLDPKKLEMLGISLGGQAISFIAKSYRNMTGQSISKLIGLDPSGPCFRNIAPELRLGPSDADFVITVSTNIEGLGIAAPSGHVSFYVNGGEYQPGDVSWFPCLAFCSHFRAFFLWVSAVQNPHSFIGIKCNSVQQARDRTCYDNVPMVTNTLDMFTDQNKRGIFSLATGNTYPYYMGEKGLKKENDEVDAYLANLNPDNMIL